MDIAYYNEIKTVQALSLEKIDQDFSNLKAWFQRMAEVEEIEESDEALYEVIEKYELDWRATEISILHILV